jgi:CHASE2 domain-containing sensor protein
MTASRSRFRLRVRLVDQSCIFDLTDPQRREISVTVPYADSLTMLYQNWQQIYRKRYELQARARVGSKGGSGTPVRYDWDQELRLAETALLTAFNHWLGQADLLPMREAIRREVEQQTPDTIQILLESCPMMLARLPWESWQLAPASAPDRVCLARTCAQVAPLAPAQSFQRGKPRLLAILAAAPELDHTLDQTILRSLQPWIDVELIHCQVHPLATGQKRTVPDLKQQIADAIADDRGWDVLFFAGHSDEAAITGGKLELAPQISLAISEIEPQLTIAQQRGLKLAIFNSCCGLHIAESLIRLGLPQVVVMRERIQDMVAHAFLQQFCRSLVQHCDVQTAIRQACHYLATENISYPSAHLIPSLFQHPDPKVTPFQIEPSRYRRLWQQWRPTRWEAIALSGLSLISLMVPVQELLFEVRAWSQSLYRQTTHQIAAAPPPPVTLLQIDQASIDRAQINAYQIQPMSRAYLATLVDRLRQLQVPVIGMDYLLDGATSEDRALEKSVEAALRQQTWFVFATRQNLGGQTVQVAPTIVNAEQILPGNIDLLGWQVMLPASAACRETCPFGYQLALAQRLQSDSAVQRSLRPIPPSLQQQVSQFLQQSPPTEPVLTFLQQPELPLGLQPVIDFSLPPHQVYRSIAAWDFLERPLNDATLQALRQQVVIIASGGYDQADDNFSLPLAVRYWRSLKNQAASTESVRSQVFSGGTAHAYFVHHLLTSHLLLRVPDLWLIVVAAVLGKGVIQVLVKQTASDRRLLLVSLAGTTVIYGFICLQSYITALIILPWCLPSIGFWLYLLPIMRRKLTER